MIFRYDHIDPHYGKLWSMRGSFCNPGQFDNSKHATRYVNRVTNLKNLEASNAFFAELVRESARGMKVILDGVFNHCGSFIKMVRPGKIYHVRLRGRCILSKESLTAVSSVSGQKTAGRITPLYEGWWDYDTPLKIKL